MLIRNTYINMASNVLAAAFGFASTVLVIRVYGAEVVGRIAYMTGLVGIVTFVVDLGIDQAGMKYISQKADDYAAEFAAYLFIKGILLLLFLAAASACLVFLFRVDDVLLYVLIMSNLFWATLADIFKNTLTARREFVRLALQTNIARGAMLVAAILFCTVWKNWYYVALLPSIEFACLVLVAAPYLVTGLGIRRLPLDRSLCRKYVRYALPLSISTGISLSIANLDKVFVGHLLDKTHVGYLAAAEKVFAVFDILVKALTQQLFPEISYRLANIREQLFKQQMEKIVLMANLMATAMALAVIAYANVLIDVIYGPGFEPSAFVLKMFAALILAKLFFRPYHSLVYATEKQAVFLWFTLPTFAVRIALTYFLIPVSVGGALIAGGARPLPQPSAWVFPRGAFILALVRRTFGTTFTRPVRLLYVIFGLAAAASMFLGRLTTHPVGEAAGGTAVVCLFFAALWFSRIIRRETLHELLAPIRPIFRRWKGRDGDLE
ncbi:MAG: oligosaccharide flippase family protein [Deltaproteobacteria bacterium]|nr:oligosaccharide flippase family protein [Deltaproteobacteria bacterium]